jgi:tetratricopeptide (TPR) repeat protein
MSEKPRPKANAQQPDVITPEEIAKMTPAQQREVANTLKETAVFLSKLTKEDVEKLQAIPFEKLQQKPDPKRPLTEEDKEAYRKMYQLVLDGHMTMAQVLGYSEAELYKIYSTGMGLSNQGRYEDAMKIADGMLFLIPKFVPAMMLKGDVLRKTDRLDEAMAVYDQAVAADPTFIQAYFERAKVSFASDNMEAFIMDIESIATLDPEAKTWYGKYARIAGQTAEEELKKAGMTAEDIAKVEAQILSKMEDIPIEKIPDVDEDGTQIPKG